MKYLFAKIFNLFICVDYDLKVEFAVDEKTSVLFAKVPSSTLVSKNCNQTFSTNRFGISSNYSAHSIKIAFIYVPSMTFRSRK